MQLPKFQGKGVYYIWKLENDPNFSGKRVRIIQNGKKGQHLISQEKGSTTDFQLQILLFLFSNGAHKTPTTSSSGASEVSPYLKEFSAGLHTLPYLTLP